MSTIAITTLSPVTAAKNRLATLVGRLFTGSNGYLADHRQPKQANTPTGMPQSKPSWHLTHNN